MTAPGAGPMPLLSNMSGSERLALMRALAEQAAAAGQPLGDTTGPLQLALRHDTTFVSRPHIEAIDNALTPILGAPSDRVMIFSPPQLGKSSMARWFLFWWLTMHPNHRMVLASYAAGLAHTHGAAVRELVRMYGNTYGLNPHATEFTKASWRVRTGGGLRSVGVRGGLSGQPMDLGVIDDPFAGRAEAESPVMRAAVWDWYSGVWTARRAPNTRELLVMCMTGDTPVLMADGTETHLRDIRPGDTVATYENGALTTANVVNWANQGPDEVYRIKMKSGRVVRANARHPFLSVENGREVWKRVSSLEPGNVLLGTGGSGEEWPARPKGATNPSPAGGCASRTTTRRDGPTASEDVPPRSIAPHACDIATASPQRSTTQWSKPSTASAPSAVSRLTGRTPALTGAASSASTTTTTPKRFAGSSVTTATSRSATARRRKSSARPPNTYSVTPDEIVEVTRCGVEDVYDVQIDRTENFIANGLVSHNTRWHADDLAGRLLDQDGRIEEGGAWRVLHMPAIALAEDVEKGIMADPLGRAPGDPISHPKIAEGDTTALLAFWADQRSRATARDWNSMWQGIPFDAAGALLSAEDVRAATDQAPPEFKRVAVGVDPSGGGRDTAGVVAAGLDDVGRVWWLADRTARASAFEWPRTACLLAHEVGAERVIYEKNYGGDMPDKLITQAWDELLREGAVAGLCPLVSPVVARKSKVLRAEPIAQATRTGRVWFARGAELKQLSTEWQMWEPGSSWSPGALDAGVHVATHLLPELTRGASVSNPSGRRRDEARVTGINARRRAVV